jgi:hypothetical protein
VQFDGSAAVQVKRLPPQGDKTEKAGKRMHREGQRIFTDQALTYSLRSFNSRKDLNNVSEFLGKGIASNRTTKPAASFRRYISPSNQASTRNGQEASSCPSYPRRRASFGRYGRHQRLDASDVPGRVRLHILVHVGRSQAGAKTRLTIVDEIHKSGRCADADSSSVLLEEFDLLFHLHVLGKLGTQ